MSLLNDVGAESRCFTHKVNHEFSLRILGHYSRSILQKYDALLEGNRPSPRYSI